VYRYRTQIDRGTQILFVISRASRSNERRDAVLLASGSAEEIFIDETACEVIDRDTTNAVSYDFELRRSGMSDRP